MVICAWEFHSEIVLENTQAERMHQELLKRSQSSGELGSIVYPILHTAHCLEPVTMQNHDSFAELKQILRTGKFAVPGTSTEMSYSAVLTEFSNRFGSLCDDSQIPKTVPIYTPLAHLMIHRQWNILSVSLVTARTATSTLLRPGLPPCKVLKRLIQALPNKRPQPH